MWSPRSPSILLLPWSALNYLLPSSLFGAKVLTPTLNYHSKFIMAMSNVGKRQAIGITSLLDTDLYKLTMQNAILQRYPKAQVSYRFTNRSSRSTPFTQVSVDLLIQLAANLSQLRLTQDERLWLEKNCPYFPQHYIDFLSTFKFNPTEEIKIAFQPFINPPQTCPRTGQPLGTIEISIQGLWCQTILYEVPLLCLISEVYFLIEDQNWDYKGQIELAKEKWKKLSAVGCQVMEFGTRRRRNFKTQQLVLTTLVNESEKLVGSGKLLGTSNVRLGKELGIKVFGTIAHELIMGEAALLGYEGANGRVMDLWESVYPDGQLNVALTDTFSTKPFWEDLVSNVDRAKRWNGLRQDSGDPKQFALQAKQIWEKMGIDPSTKTIVFSDGLDPDRCVELQQLCQDQGLSCSFGVGTNFTNDFRRAEVVDYEDDSGEGQIGSGPKSKALNIVIKLSEIDGKHCVKISDELTKNTGDEETVKWVKEHFGLTS